VTNGDTSGWLESVLVSAQGAGWCMSPYCTTCGCLGFRRAFWTAAARQAGVGTARLESARHPRGFFEGFSAGEREAIVRALVAGLRQLPPQWSDSKAFRTIIIDLYPPLIKHGVPMALANELSATPAGEGLARMEAHAEWRETYESPQAVEERKRVTREEKSRAHALRQSQTRKRNTERLGLLSALARPSVADRLSRFAMDPALKLDCVSLELIPAQESELVGLETATAVALIARIDRRKGEWGRLRRMLENLIKG